MRGRPGRRDREEGRRALSRRPDQELAQDQMHQPAGAGDRRLDAERQEGARLPVAAAGAATRTASCVMPARSAPASRQATQLELREKLDALAVEKAPVAVPRAEARGARWVKPKLVAEIAFAEFTADNVVRHASFLGLRGDKPAGAGGEGDARGRARRSRRRGEDQQSGPGDLPRSRRSPRASSPIIIAPSRR